MTTYGRAPTVLAAAALAWVLPSGVSEAKIKVTVEHHAAEEASPPFTFKTVPPPARDDAGTKAVFSLVDGRRDRNGGDLEKLHDSRLPVEEDQPAENFFFAAGTEGVGGDLYYSYRTTRLRIFEGVTL